MIRVWLPFRGGRNRSRRSSGGDEGFRQLVARVVGCAGSVALSALLLSCGGNETPEPVGGIGEAGRPREPTAEFDPPSREEFVQAGLRSLGTDRTTFAQSLGEPDSTRAEVVPNRHLPGVQDTLLTLYYPDLFAHIHRPGPGGELLSSVEVSSNDYLVHPAIGASVGAIVAALGDPDERSDSTLTYLCTSCVAADNPVQMIVADGRVQRVRFNYYVD